MELKELGEYWAMPNEAKLMEFLPAHLMPAFKRLVARTRNELNAVGFDTRGMLPQQILKRAQDER